MSRQHIQDRLMDYLYEEMSSEEARAFEQALREHPDLEAEVEGHRRTRSMFERLPEMDVPNLVTADILREARKAADVARAAREPRKSFLERMLALLMQPAAATAMVVLLVAGVGVYVSERGILQSDKDTPDDRYRPAHAPAELRSEGKSAVAPRAAEGLAGTEESPVEEAPGEAAPAEEPEPEAPVTATVEVPATPRGGEAAATAEAQRPAPDLLEAKPGAAAPAPRRSKVADSLDGLLLGDRKKVSPKKGWNRDEDARELADEAQQLGSAGRSRADDPAKDVTVPLVRGTVAETPAPAREEAPMPQLAEKKESVSKNSGIASNVEQRPGAFGADTNAVRDGFAGLQAKEDEAASGAPVAKQPSAPPSAYPAQQQQMSERRAEEIVYGAAAATDDAEAVQQAVAEPVEPSVSTLANKPAASAPIAQDLLAQGDALLAEGNAQAAVDLYEAASKADASLAALARHKTARAYRSSNRYLDALMSYDGLLEGYPRYQNRLAALQEKFEVSLALGRLDVAEKVLKEMELVEGGGAQVASLRERLYARRVAQEKSGGAGGQKAGEAAKTKAASKAKSSAPADAPMEMDKVVK